MQGIGKVSWAFLAHTKNQYQQRPIFLQMTKMPEIFVADDMSEMLGAPVKLSKLNKLQSIAALPQQWAVERSQA
ncbi:hypothetical protein [Collimonas silvisoli]|uniref:hypothetical protein n=1 Tax=Collimonas silvisoli TaxID=2825884 RepID=UPI001B8B14D7|nr:hypothetical protein [Collimonas silvisoli]